MLMGKQKVVLDKWRARAAEEAADASLPKTVPPFSAEYIWGMVGNSIAQQMASVAVEEFVDRYGVMKRLLLDGSVVLEPGLPEHPDALYDAEALAWRRRTLAGENFVAKAPDACGIDDGHLDVTKRRAKGEEVVPDDQAEQAVGYLRALASGEVSLASCAGATDREVTGWWLGGAGAQGSDGSEVTGAGSVGSSAKAATFGPRDRPNAQEWEAARKLFVSCSGGSPKEDLLGATLALRGEDADLFDDLPELCYDSDSEFELDSDDEGGPEAWDRVDANVWPLVEACGAMRVSRRAPAPRQLLRMPADFRGGDRAWRESGAPDESVREEENSSKRDDGEENSAKSKSAATAKAKPVKSAKGASSKPASKPAASAKGARAGKSAAQRKGSAAVEQQDPPRPAFGIKAASVTGQQAAARAFGPVRPEKVRAKDKRKHGIALASLEMQKLFAIGDWNAIEEFATYRLPMFSLAWSSLKGYESSWTHWVSFQSRAQLPIFMRTSTTFEKNLCSKWMLSFVALLAFGVHYKPSTTKTCLMAIRLFHLAHDYDNPLDSCPRVWQGYKAIKRACGPTERKFPITPEMMDWLDGVQRKQGLSGSVKRSRTKYGVPRLSFF